MVKANCPPSLTAHPTPSPLRLVQPVADWQELNIGSLTRNLTVDIGNSFGELGSPVQGIQPASPIREGEKESALGRRRDTSE